MSISKKKSKQSKSSKVQYNLDRQTANIFALSSGNISKYEFLTAKMFYPKKTC